MMLRAEGKITEWIAEWLIAWVGRRAIRQAMAGIRPWRKSCGGNNRARLLPSGASFLKDDYVFPMMEATVIKPRRFVLFLSH
jgi:hypothetical protein